MTVSTPGTIHWPLQFDNRFVRELPADVDISNSRRQVYRACYSRVQPTKVRAPKLVAYSREMAATLGLSEELSQSAEFAEVFAGNKLLAGMDPFAMCYGGHQFGNWAGQLGDGRVINLGEVLDQQGEHWMLQLKGAGETPYSRNADGLAVLRSSLREFICSEAMYHLGIPTTRALSLVLTGESVTRDMFYDGHPRQEPGAICCRVSPSFTRLGQFQLFASRNELDLLKTFVDYTIRADFPHLQESGDEVYGLWFKEVCERTARLMVHWMRVGFVHGVMNTDNLSILGLTIDYGPYGWLENFDPNWTPNTTDAQGRRYCYGNQPYIGQWNLLQLANALVPLFGDTQVLQDGLQHYVDTYERGWQQMMSAKLGLREYEAVQDGDIFQQLLQLLAQEETDMTIFYRCLAHFDRECSIDAENWIELLRPAYYQADALSSDYRQAMQSWLRTYQQRLQKDALDRVQRIANMNAVNPKFVARNYLAQLAIDQVEQGNFRAVEEWLNVLRNPYAEQPGSEKYAEKRPEWARNRAGCSMLSCSS